MKARIISTVLLALFLVSLPLATIIAPKAEASEMENRKLAVFPSFSLKGVVSRDYMNKLESWFSDHFIGRDHWVGAKGYLEYATGKRENNGVYICGDRLIGEADEPDENKTQKNIEAIRQFVQANQKPTYLMLVPTAAEINRELLPYGAQSWDQRSYIKEIAKQLRDTVTEIDVYKVLYENKGEYLYYRTDHHWTSGGAFFAFTEAAKRMGILSVEKKNYNVRNVSHNFYGTLYSKVGYRSISPDIISTYTKRGSQLAVSVDVSDGATTETYESMYFTDYLNGKDQYAMFLGQNQPLVTINTNSSSGKRLLIFKDSYAHAMAPMFADYYGTITLVDLRYINQPYNTVVDVSQYDQVLILYNVDTFSHSADAAKLGITR